MGPSHRGEPPYRRIAGRIDVTLTACFIVLLVHVALFWECLEGETFLTNATLW